jgi:adenylate cyclase
MRMWKRRHAYLISLGLAAALALPWGLLQPPLLDDLRNFVFDSYQRIEPRPHDPETPARVVGVDEASLAAFGQWPWPRARLAELVDRLRDLGAAAIAFDFIFAEPDRSSLENFALAISDARARRELARIIAGSPGNDQLFARSLARAPVVLGVTLAAAGAPNAPKKAGFAYAGDDPAPFVPAFAAVVAPLATLSESAKGLGATNWLPDRDQIVRRVQLLGSVGGSLVPALALEALRVAQGESTIVIRASNASGQTAFGRKTGVNAIKAGAFEIATGAGAEVRPRYRRTQAVREISAAAVLRGETPRQEIEGRIVFVGALAAGLGDIRATPLEPAVPGVDIHAQIIESIAAGALLSRPDWAPGLEFFVALSAFAGAMTLLFAAPPFVSAAAGLLAVAALFGGSFYLFDAQGLLLDPAYPSLTIIGGYLVGAFTRWRLEQAGKRHIREAFGKFVAPAVVDRLAENPERLVLGGETRELTVLFSDLRGFSAMSEGLSARELTQFMNDYFTPMTDVILDCEGAIDKYVGDAILAFWNAPLDVADHPRKAVTAALRMRAALAAFNAARASAARAAGREHWRAAMGLGLNLGPCNVGNMGSIKRFDYSILGDTVNLASRLDGVCKMFNTDIIVSSAVREAAPDFAWLDLGRVIVLGRAAPASIHALAGGAEFARGSAFQAWREAHDRMRAHYEAARFAEAAAAASSHGAGVAEPWRALYMVMEQRFAALNSAGAREGWSSIWSLGGK